MSLFRKAESMIDGIDSDNLHQYRSIPSLIFIIAHVNNQKMKVMIDTGANHSLINEKFIRFNDQFKHFKIHPEKFLLIDGLTSFMISETVQLNILIGDKITSIPPFIAKNDLNPKSLNSE